MTRRILYLHHASNRSGATVSLGVMARAAISAGYSANVALARPTDEVREYFESLELETLDAPNIGLFLHTTGGWARLSNPLDVGRVVLSAARIRRSNRAVAEVIAQTRPDLVHLNSVVLAPAAIGVRRMGLPLLWQIRESVARGHIGLRRRVLASMLRTLPNATLFLSDADREAAGGGHNARVIPNWSSFPSAITSKARAETRRRLGVGEDAPLIVFLGGLSLIKGVVPLARALEQLATTHPGVRTVVTGVHAPSRRWRARLARWVLPKLGAATPSQRARFALMRLGDAVLLLPWVAEPQSLITAADVLVFPSIEPHFARPVVEAMTVGVPVVGSDLAGVRELINDGRTGWLVPPGDSEELACTLREVLDSPSERARRADAARLEAVRRFSEDRCLPQILALYEDIVAS